MGSYRALGQVSWASARVVVAIFIKLSDSLIEVTFPGARNLLTLYILSCLIKNYIAISEALKHASTRNSCMLSCVAMVRRVQKSSTTVCSMRGNTNLFVHTM